MSNSLRPHRLKPTRFICPWNSPDKNMEWVAIPFSRGSYQPRNWTHVPYISCIAGRIFYHLNHQGSWCLVYGKLLVYGKFKFCSWIFLMHGQLNVERYNPQIPTTDLLEYTEYPQTCQLKKPRKNEVFVFNSGGREGWYILFEF